MLRILTESDPVLRQVAEPVRKIDGELLALATEMLKAMYEARGVGLAAPQVGVGKRLIVLDVGDGPMTLINPSIVRSAGEEVCSEGCLSIPGMVGDVCRKAEVEVEALDRGGHRIVVRGHGLLARALQHEIDHLNGVLFTDLATNIRPAESEGEA